eukprot:9716096-Heterocapsa_arctica.AAC.1
MPIRRVETEDGRILTILPWANNINNARCVYCNIVDHHEICPPGGTCRRCEMFLTRAQDELVPSMPLVALGPMGKAFMRMSPRVPQPTPDLAG